MPMPPMNADDDAKLRAERFDDIEEELELEIAEAVAEMASLDDGPEGRRSTLDRTTYFTELFRLQHELVKLQDWIQEKGLKLVVVFEGRDSAGKGGAIKRITQRLSPRVCKVVALPAPTRRERSQWYFQRYVAHLPAAGEMVLFDRSWYNRAGWARGAPPPCRRAGSGAG